jgi:hypothetical protein
MLTVILSTLGLFCLAMGFGLALVSTKWSGRAPYEDSEEEGSC